VRACQWVRVRVCVPVAVCGPPGFNKAMGAMLKTELEVDNVRLM